MWVGIGEPNCVLPVMTALSLRMVQISQFISGSMEVQGLLRYVMLNTCGGWINMKPTQRFVKRPTTAHKWPVLVRQVKTLFVMLLSFKVFDEVYLLTQGGPGTATEVLSFTVFRVFFDDDREGFGSAMSMSIIMMVIALLLIGALATRRRERTA